MVKVEDLVKVVMMELGLEMGDEIVVVFVRGVWGWGEAAVTVATGEGLGLEKRDVDVTSVTAALGVLLAFPHSASTSAMMSPPAIESKVRREEMSASKELRLVSPGTSGGSGVDKGVTCSLVLLTSPGVTWGVFDGDVAVLS